MRFYGNDIEAARESGRRAEFRLLLAEWRGGGGSAAALIRNTIHPSQQATVEALVRQASLAGQANRWAAGEAIRAMRAFADDHVAKAAAPYIPAAESWSWFLGQGDKVDRPTKGTIHDGKAQTVLG